MFVINKILTLYINFEFIVRFFVKHLIIWVRKCGGTIAEQKFLGVEIQVGSMRPGDVGKVQNSPKFSDVPNIANHRLIDVI